MSMNDRVEVDKSAVVSPNKTRLRRLLEHFRRRKLIWIISFNILIVTIIVIQITIILVNKNKRETTSATLTTTTSSTKTTSSTTTRGQLVSCVVTNNNTKWKKNAITVAGEYGQGSALNQLNWPSGIYIDDNNQSIYIADSGNHRILRWEFGARRGEIVAGGKGYGNAIDQLDYPLDVVLDKAKKYLIICDQGNRRLIRWSRQNSQDQQILISYIFCWGLAMDNNGDLCISDYGTGKVKRWREGDTEGTVVAGGNGQGNKLNQLNEPNYIFVDEYYSVYVADDRNNRVMKWTKHATEGILVAPEQVSDKNPNPLSRPTGVIVDRKGDIYVSINGTHQIWRWSTDAIESDPVVGKNLPGSGSAELENPYDLSFDRQGNLYVVDLSNHRIQKFFIDLDCNKF
ncbi:unnamed protein product [Adineta steineri]|uniref:NHL repeat containing protein-like protein n=1 Tax=Adineta steineri TaxID=433720 RepID=A0A815CBX4_9BILA|nr:unnamed protein product [Adineta steineri]CAF4148134.1 unnamed protein product [Adineta steineri]